MKLSKKLLTSIVCLVLSLAVCVVVCFAWYSNNKKVFGDGAKMETYEGDIESLTVTKHVLSSPATDKDGNLSYTVGEELANDKMTEYGKLAGGVTAVLIKIDYTFRSTAAGKNFDLSVERTSDYGNRPDRTDDDGKIVVTKDEATEIFSSELTNAVHFKTATKSGNTVTIAKGTAQLSFVENEAKIVSDFISVDNNISGSTAAGSRYIVLDYDSNYIAYLYSLALNSGGNLNTKFDFIDDISVRLCEA